MKNNNMINEQVMENVSGGKIYVYRKWEYITIQPGNTLSGIAASHGITLAELLAKNPRYQKNPNYIVAGWPVFVPVSYSVQR